MTPYFDDGQIQIYHGDCREILPMLPKVDLVLTDPPYPDCFTDLYGYSEDLIQGLDSLQCRQFVFWSARTPFPLSYTAIHIWNKNPSNKGAQYERIFERNGQKHYKVYTYYMVNSTVAASFARDVFNEHPSQKPLQLIKKLIIDAKANSVIDPFMGSGTTLKAARDLGVKAIGIEINEKYCEIATRRLAQNVFSFDAPELERVTG